MVLRRALGGGSEGVPWCDPSAVMYIGNIGQEVCGERACCSPVGCWWALLGSGGEIAWDDGRTDCLSTCLSTRMHEPLHVLALNIQCFLRSGRGGILRDVEQLAVSMHMSPSLIPVQPATGCSRTVAGSWQ